MSDRNQSSPATHPPVSNRSGGREPWQDELANSFRNLGQLLDFLGLDRGCFAPLKDCSDRFPFKVTRYFAAKIEKGNPADPLLLQILPNNAEFEPSAGFSDDPVGDLEKNPGPGVIHKYPNRVLLITTGACAVNCRYCFRRNYPYSGNQLGQSGRRAALGYIASHPEINEVILSGGDPLVLSNPDLEELIRAIEAIRHVERLRIHTRIPSVLPARIDRGLIRLLGHSRLKSLIVAHINHPREIDDRLRERVAALSLARIPILNQAVLLRGINDDPKTLADLFETAFDAGIHPYYLHLLDRATGTRHFEVERDRALSLEENLRRTLPGYLLPRFVCEIPGEPYKVPIDSR